MHHMFTRGPSAIKNPLTNQFVNLVLLSFFKSTRCVPYYV